MLDTRSLSVTPRPPRRPGARRRHTPLRAIGLPLVALSALTACGTSQASSPGAEPTAPTPVVGGPVEIENCSWTVALDRPAERVVTMNQGATEVVLALGAQDHLVGTAYLDDRIPDRWQAAYHSVPVLSPNYPSQESVLARDPDLVYGSYASALRHDAAGDPAMLTNAGIGAYLSPAACPDERPERYDQALVAREIREVARLLGMPDAGERLVAEQDEALAGLAAQRPAVGQRIVWLDSTSPSVGAGQGAPQFIIDTVGGTNVFADLPKSWNDVGWEAIVTADPDVVVVVDTLGESADAKIERFRTDPALRGLRAVRENRFVTVPFSATTPGVRVVEGAQIVADGIRALTPP